MAAFDEVRMPTKWRLNARGGPKTEVAVVILGSGFEQRNVNWEQARREYTVEIVDQSDAALDEVMAFFVTRQGRGNGFRVKDHTDFKLARQVIEQDAGGNWQVYKRYDFEGVTHDRPLPKLVSGTVKVWVNSVLKTEGAGNDYTVDYNTGRITFNIAIASGDVVEVECEFDVPCRLDTDLTQWLAAHAKGASWPAIKLVELRRKPGVA